MLVNFKDRYAVWGVTCGYLFFLSTYNNLPENKKYFVIRLCNLDNYFSLNFVIISRGINHITYYVYEEKVFCLRGGCWHIILSCTTNYLYYSFTKWFWCLVSIHNRQCVWNTIILGIYKISICKTFSYRAYN